MKDKDKFCFRKVAVPVVVMVAFLILGTAMWLSSGYIQALFFFGYMGVSIGIGVGLYAALPKTRKPLGRKLTLSLVGRFLLVFMGVLQSENMQIEWGFFSLLAGLMGVALIHYLIAKIFGPFLLGRLWCGWACWTVMILDLLQYSRRSGRLPGRWGWLSYCAFCP